MTTTVLDKKISQVLDTNIQVLEVLEKTKIDWTWDPKVSITKFIFKSVGE